MDGRFASTKRRTSSRGAPDLPAADRDRASLLVTSAAPTVDVAVATVNAIAIATVVVVTTADVVAAVAIATAAVGSGTSLISLSRTSSHASPLGGA